ncbi:MAG TPA: EAL domain-containing protein, partial [Anaerolineales bacterium]|nr:EAL domain-containing protein [Anaerolineales bacterium]
PGSFTDEDEARLTDLADYASVAIENASLYEQAQQEILERKRIEQALRESEERYALAVQGANDGLWDWDLRSNQIYYSPRWKSILGLAETEVGHHPDEWYNRVHLEDIERLKLDISAHMAGLTPHFENEHRILHKDGEYIWVQSRALAVREEDGVAYRMAGSLTDITDRKNAEQRLLHDAFHDTLTGLPNRALFLDRLRQAVERSKRRTDFTYAVLFLDLDRFKDVNDTLGHMLGDQLLVIIGKMLESGLRSTDTVARLGGDEFVILMEDITNIQGAMRVANWVHEMFKTPIHVLDHQVFISTSIGIVSGGLNYARPEDILRDADIAMYSAKAHGRARSEVFEPEMRVRISRRLLIESELRQAIEHEEFVIHYQPIISLEDQRITGFEALVRWNHPIRGLLIPADFLYVAEESGLIVPIDRWVLRQACFQMKTWQDQYPIQIPLTISVNLSGRHVTRPDLVDYIQNVLKETRLAPTCLKLEITENILMETNLLTSETFHRLQALGVQLQIDDFGIGYSSLSYLSQFPVNALKIDQSFIKKMAVDNSQLEIVQAIVMLAQRLDVVVVAEGVETAAQLHQLQSLGCEYGQGFYVSKPLESAGIEAILAGSAGKGLLMDSL